MTELGNFLRRTASHRHHPVGTCTMGVGPLAVVDAELKVHGIEGLREDRDHGEERQRNPEPEPRFPPGGPQALTIAAVASAR